MCCVCVKKNSEKQNAMLHHKLDSGIPKLKSFGRVLSFGRWVARSEKVILRWLLRKVCCFYSREKKDEEEKKERKLVGKWWEGDDG